MKDLLLTWLVISIDLAIKRVVRLLFKLLSYLLPICQSIYLSVCLSAAKIALLWIHKAIRCVLCSSISFTAVRWSSACSLSMLGSLHESRQGIKRTNILILLPDELSPLGLWTSQKVPQVCLFYRTLMDLKLDFNQSVGKSTEKCPSYFWVKALSWTTGSWNSDRKLKRTRGILQSQVIQDQIINWP